MITKLQVDIYHYFSTILRCFVLFYFHVELQFLPGRCRLPRRRAAAFLRPARGAAARGVGDGEGTRGEGWCGQTSAKMGRKC